MAGENTSKSVTLKFTPEATAELEELQRSCGFSSQEEAVRYALRLMAYLREESLRGNSFAVGNEESGFREMKIVPFDLERFTN